MEVQSSGSSTALLSNQEIRPSPPETVLVQLRPARHVSWDGTAADNEHQCKKKSKKCCVYHRKRDFDESSTDHSGSDSDACNHKSIERGEVRQSPPDPQASSKLSDTPARQPSADDSQQASGRPVKEL